MAGDAGIAEGEGRGVVAGDEEVGPAVAIEVERGECLGVTRHNKAALVETHGGEVTVTIAAQQLAQSAVEAADGGNRGKGVLHGVDIRLPVAVEVPGNDTLQGGDLRQARQRFEAPRAVGLAQENATAQLGGGKLPGGLEFILT